MPDLAKALTTTVTSIGQIKLPERPAPETAEQPEVDADAVAGLLDELLSGLELDNPDAVAPILDELRTQLGNEAVEPIRSQVNDFDFDRAKEETQNLIQRINNK